MTKREAKTQEVITLAIERLSSLFWGWHFERCGNRIAAFPPRANGDSYYALETKAHIAEVHSNFYIIASLR